MALLAAGLLLSGPPSGIAAREERRSGLGLGSGYGGGKGGEWEGEGGPALDGNTSLQDYTTKGTFT